MWMCCFSGSACFHKNPENPCIRREVLLSALSFKTPRSSKYSSIVNQTDD
eukprot:UN03371